MENNLNEHFWQERAAQKMHFEVIKTDLYNHTLLNFRPFVNDILGRPQKPVIESAISSPVLMPDGTFGLIGLDIDSESKGSFNMLNFKLYGRVEMKGPDGQQWLEVRESSEKEEVIAKAYFLK